MKQKILFLSFAVATSFANLKAQVTNGLVAKYSFNNGNANDEIGNNDGVVNGATLTTDRFGNANMAYSFDGNDYINLGDSAEFQMGYGDFSVSIWVNYSIAQQAVIFQKRAGASANYNMYSLSVLNDPQMGGVSQDIYAFLRSSNSEDRSIYAGNLPGAWHHIVLSHKYFDSTSIFVDGLLVNSSSAMLTGEYNIAGNNLVIGAISDMNSFFYTGKIDDIRIYNTALTIQEVNTLFNEVDPMTIGINETTVTKNTIEVFPNPVESSLSIEIENSTEVLITDILGKVVIIKNIDSNGQIDVSDLLPGMYFVQTKEGAKTKFIKQ